MKYDCLNPCFVGMWSFRKAIDVYRGKTTLVLILVLLGCGLLEQKMYIVVC